MRLLKYNEYLYRLKKMADLPVDVIVKELKGTWAKLHRATINQENGRAVFSPHILLCRNNNYRFSKNILSE